MKLSDNISNTCKYCDEPVYSTLTNGLCLSCYQREREECRQADIESECDYYDGDMEV